MKSTDLSPIPERNSTRNVVMAFVFVEAVGIAALIIHLIGR